MLCSCCYDCYELTEFAQKCDNMYEKPPEADNKKIFSARHNRHTRPGVCTFWSYTLTHCCAWPAEGRNVLHIERSWPAIRAALTDRPMYSSTCCSQFFHGWPVGRFQSAAGWLLVWASIDSCSAYEAGVFSGRRQMWPNNEWHLSAIRDGTSGSFVLSLTTALDTLSYHLIPRIRRSACMWSFLVLTRTKSNQLRSSYGRKTTSTF